MFISAALLAALALESAANAEPPAVRVALALDPRLPAVVRKVAIEEAGSIWRPYGVDVVAAERSAPTLTVRLAASAAAPPEPPSPFASIRFADGDQPLPIIALYYDRLQTIGLARVLVAGLGQASWPPVLRDQVLGRIAGRALAHEVGHWLLRTKTHSAKGLMRAIQPATEMADAARGHFRLSREDVVLLAEAKRRWGPVSGGSAASK